VILTDDMRIGDWDMLADTQRLVGGTMFPNFVFNTPLCCPFRASFQRGQMAHNTGITTNHGGIPFHETGLDTDTIATALHDAGYFTAYAGKYMNTYTGRPPGWDVWHPQEGGLVRYRSKDGTYLTTAITHDALDAIAQAPADQPLLLMVGHRAPHDPWTPEATYKDADVGPVRNTADADRKRTLLSVDDSVEEIAAALGSRWDAAVVIVLTDNGYLLGEHGTRGKSIWWDQAQRVPSLIRAPGISGREDDRLVSTVDIPATILFAAGARMHHPIDGRPLQEAWSREGVLIESWVGGSARSERTPYRGIKGDGWVYVEAKGKAPRYYEMPDEDENLIGTLSPERRKQLAEWLAELKDCQGSDCLSLGTPP
jgi:N-acetylglucosamine-6-sulfatase